MKCSSALKVESIEWIDVWNFHSGRNVWTGSKLEFALRHILDRHYAVKHVQTITQKWFP